MRVVILCGGLGTRLSELTEVTPKPMVEIGGRPILWHIMQIYSSFGFRDFSLCLGYKGEVVKRYFLNYHYLSHDFTIDLADGSVDLHDGDLESWRVQLVDTGLKTQTGGRVKRLERWIQNETFMLTYGDGLADIDISRLLEFHRQSGKLATVTAVRPSARFGGLGFDGDLVTRFEEKPPSGEGWINGGFFVFEPEVLQYIQGDETILEREPLERLAQEGQLAAYRHDSFWQCMDTLRDVRLLESLWQSGKAPWKAGVAVK